MSDEDLPFMTSREDPMTDHVEFVGPFQQTFVVLNGHKVPHLKIGPDEGDEVLFVIDDRIAAYIPQSHVTPIVSLMADIVAIERGYARFPRTPGEEPPKAQPFGPIMMEVEIEE